jgi:glycolate oxidase FAD binding subunit
MSSDAPEAAPAFDEVAAALATGSPASFRVDGMQPARVVCPESVEDLTELLRAASADGVAMIPWGGGSQIGLGNVPARYDVALDLSRFGDIIRYEPDDMTISLQAGCRLAGVNRLLHEHRQVLPIDASDPERATIGGLVAAGISGPRRFGYGPLRDLIIGIAVAYPDGSLAKAGGLVVKNVTGFDMMRLHHGALGSLGVIVSVNLKVIPQPQAQRTVLAEFATSTGALAAASSIRRSPLGATALAILNGYAVERVGLSPSRSTWTVIARAEAPPSAAARQAERLSEAISDGAERVWTVDDTDETASLWVRAIQGMSAAPSNDEIGVRLGCPSSALGDLIARMAGMLEVERRADVEITIDAGSGLVYLRIPAAELEPAGSRTLWDELVELGEHATLLTAPPEVKQGIDVYGRAPTGFSVMRALKQRFDPSGILNPGRYIGHL